MKVRLIPLARASGPGNMALDEAVVEAVAAGAAPPTLRIYGWDGRWLSIGMSESVADVDLGALRSAGVGLLRRPSGGTAVLHADQVGWSLTLPAGHPLAPGDILSSYEAQSRITLDALERLGIAARAASVAEARQPLPDAVLSMVCFGGLAPHEIVFGDPPRKLIGWGQVRRRGVVMHHAVVHLHLRAGELTELLNAERGRLEEALRARVLDIGEAAQRAIGPQELADALVGAYRMAGLELVVGEPTPAEAGRAGELVAAKYADDGWTFRR